MMQIITGCTGDNCPKHKDCELYYENLAKKQKCSFPLESWATFGSGIAWANSETGESGYKDEWYCGPNGNYKMFKPYVRPLSELTLGEMRDICYEHQRKGRDCETCNLYKFCNYEMTTNYPSAWKLNNEGNQ